MCIIGKARFQHIECPSFQTGGMAVVNRLVPVLSVIIYQVWGWVPSTKAEYNAHYSSQTLRPTLKVRSPGFILLKLYFMFSPFICGLMQFITLAQAPSILIFHEIF